MHPTAQQPEPNFSLLITLILTAFVVGAILPENVGIPINKHRPEVNFGPARNPGNECASDETVYKEHINWTQLPRRFQRRQVKSIRSAHFLGVERTAQTQTELDDVDVT